MINFFNEEEIVKAKDQRTKVLVIYFITLAIMLALFAVVFIAYLQLPYQDPLITPLKLAFELVLVVYVTFSCIYLSIKFKRVNKYYKYLLNMKKGLKETSEGEFLGYVNSIQKKDGVEFKFFNVKMVSKKTGKETERKVLVDNEKEFPVFEEGQKIRIITQGNVLYSYEIME